MDLVGSLRQRQLRVLVVVAVELVGLRRLLVVPHRLAVGLHLALVVQVGLDRTRRRHRHHLHLRLGVLVALVALHLHLHRHPHLGELVTPVPGCSQDTDLVS
jgi:hypothetical protein